jgi:hypothetical protein
MLCALIKVQMEVMTTKIKTYSELRKLKTFEERYEYLSLKGTVGASIFGSNRYINQNLYRSKRWRDARDFVIIRDSGCDLGILDREIQDKILIHHINPLGLEDIENDVDEIYDPEYLICTTHNTHQAIHYGDSNLLLKDYTPRQKNDTRLWNKKGGI